MPIFFLSIRTSPLPVFIIVQQPRGVGKKDPMLPGAFARPLKPPAGSAQKQKDENHHKPCETETFVV